MKKYTVTKDWANDQLVLSRRNKKGREKTFRFNVGNLNDIHIDDEETKSIRWDISDFAQQAVEKEERLQNRRGLAERPTLYDRTKFPNALQQMIKNHDCNLGITWDTIDDYLDTMCKI